MIDSLYTQLRNLPVGATLVLPLGVTTQSAEHAITSVVHRYPERRYAIGSRVVQPRPGEAVRYLHIERLSDSG